MTVISRPPVLRISHKSFEVFHDRVEIERLELSRVIEILAHRIGEFGILPEYWATRWGLEVWLGTEGLLVQLIQLSVAGAIGLGVFAVLAARTGLPEVDQLVARLRQRFGR
ncbi:hypothetical protein [Leptolyngbya sp. 7M]|uniref:hypothetical protein n=1 Tax=Leptolyngbya sp. 7M TaxID=2812896 RepID=UPI001B8D9416|nr:hypothetical protein [Leptolyngbya sp. 7M]QYO68894.1 hypothetical protein JVX88_22585 [Leptolyngbya sp. 7M]